MLVLDCFDRYKTQQIVHTLWYKVHAVAYDCIAILLHVSVENAQLRKEGNEQTNRNIHQHHSIKVHSYPVTTMLLTWVGVNHKGGWIRNCLDQFHFIDSINSFK